VVRGRGSVIEAFGNLWVVGAAIRVIGVVRFLDSHCHPVRVINHGSVRMFGESRRALPWIHACKQMSLDAEMAGLIDERKRRRRRRWLAAGSRSLWLDGWRIARHAADAVASILITANQYHRGVFLIGVRTWLE